MQVLLIGNHTCGNRGDAAILRGLIEEIERTRPDAAITVTSRFPTSSSYLLGRKVIADVFNDRGGSFFTRVRRRLRPYLLWLAAAPGGAGLARLLAPRDREKIAWLASFDLIIQVGGSFFVDLYGVKQFETPFAALVSGRPLMLLGHSLGPARTRIFRRFLSRLLEGAKPVALREEISREMVEALGLPMANVTRGADTAWLVEPSPAPAPAGRRIALTIRELAPFDRLLGTTQQAYEQALADLADRVMGEGWDVVAVSTCTGIDAYHRDDRMNALRVRDRVKDPARFDVIMDELDDRALGRKISECALVVGTRLHSAIIGMNFGVPAVAINYEHKSRGIMRRLGLPQCSADIQDLLNGTLADRVVALLGDLPALGQATRDAVALERMAAREMVREALAGGPSS